MDEIPGYSPSTFHQVSYLLYCQCLNYSFFCCLQLRRKRKNFTTRSMYWLQLLRKKFQTLLFQTSIIPLKSQKLIWNFFFFKKYKNANVVHENKKEIAKNTRDYTFVSFHLCRNGG